MNCCDANGHCTLERDCPARQPPCPLTLDTIFECELPCSPEPAGVDLYSWPRYPFAPGVIEGPKTTRWSGFGEGCALLTRHQNQAVLLLVLLLAVLGSVLGGFLAGYLPWPAWLTVGLPG